MESEGQSILLVANARQVKCIVEKTVRPTVTHLRQAAYHVPGRSLGDWCGHELTLELDRGRRGLPDQGWPGTPDRSKPMPRRFGPPR
jgi:hypothetical protein